MKRRLAAAILTATVATGAMTLPAAAEWNGEQEAACTQSIGTPQGNGWQCIGGTWYLINQDGTRRQGWYREKGQWYFLNDRGAMVTGWTEIDGRVYCFGSDGVMMTGSAEEDGAVYTLGQDGAMEGDLEEGGPALTGIYVTISGIVRAVA